MPALPALPALPSLPPAGLLLRVRLLELLLLLWMLLLLLLVLLRVVHLLVAIRVEICACASLPLPVSLGAMLTERMTSAAMRHAPASMRRHARTVPRSTVPARPAPAPCSTVVSMEAQPRRRRALG